MGLVSFVGQTVAVDDVQGITMRYEIRAEQVRLIYRQGPLFWVGAAVTACVIALIGYNNSGGHQHLGWLAVVMFGAAIRLRLLLLYKTHDPSVALSDWGRRFTLSSTLSGLLWGSWPFWFYSTANTDFLLMITALIATMIAVLANSGSVYLPAFVCFALPLCLTSVLFLVQSDSEVLVWTGWLLCLCFFVNLALALRNNHQHCELLRARYRNDELLDQLDKKKRIAENAVQQKNRFITTASHDLRQPLHALTLLTAALARSSLSHRQRSIVDDVRKSNRALNEHFNVILDLSRLESNSIDVIEQRFSVVDVLKALVVEFGAQARDKQLQLRLELSVADAVFVTDRILLERILRNLLSNAVKFTQHGEIVVFLSKMPCGGFELAIKDSGEGIARCDIDNIFDEYSRASNTGSGLGLGLSIVHHLCRLLAVHVSVESTPGQGTCFTLTVPNHLVDHDIFNQHIVTNGCMAEPAELNGLRLLVIDDDEDNLVACQHLFESYAVTVMLAQNVKVAFDLLADTGKTTPVPSVILCDYHLCQDRGQDVTALEVIAQLRDYCGTDVPACIISGDTSAQVVSDVAAAGFTLLHKPIDEDALVACITTLTNPLTAGSETSNRVAKPDASLAPLRA